MWKVFEIISAPVVSAVKLEYQENVTRRDGTEESPLLPGNVAGYMPRTRVSIWGGNEGELRRGEVFMCPLAENVH